MSIIELKSVSKKYKKLHALNNISLNIEQGKIYGLMGPNGAGKTTLVKTILGGIEPTTGTINVFGYKPGHIEAKQKIGYVCEKNALPLNEVAYEYLLTMAILSALNLEEAKREILYYGNKFGLNPYLYQKIKTFSSGMKKKLQIISSLFNHPELLILDEPTENLDPQIRAEILRFLKELNSERNLTILYCSHNLFELENLVDHLLFVNQGKLMIEGNYQDIKNQHFESKRLKLETTDNEQVLRYLSQNYQIEVLKHQPIIIRSNQIESMKMDVIKYCANHEINIHELMTEDISMFELYELYAREEKK